MRKAPLHHTSPVFLSFPLSTTHKGGNPIDYPCPIVHYLFFFPLPTPQAPLCENCIPLPPPSLSRPFFARAQRERTHAL